MVELHLGSRRTQIAVGSFIFIILLVAAYLQFGRRPKRVELEWGEPVNGLQAAFDLLSEDGVVALGQPVGVRFRLRNVGKKPILLASEPLRYRDRVLLFPHRTETLVKIPYSPPVPSQYGTKTHLIQPGKTITLDHSGLVFVDSPRWAETVASLGCTAVDAPPGIQTVAMEMEFSRVPGAQAGRDGAASLAVWQGRVQTGPRAVCVVPSPAHAGREIEAASFLDFGFGESETAFGGFRRRVLQRRYVYLGGPPTGRRTTGFDSGYLAPRFLRLATDFRAGLYDVRMVRFDSEFRGAVRLRDADAPVASPWKPYRVWSPPIRLPRGGIPIGIPGPGFPTRNLPGETIVPAGKELKIQLVSGGPPRKPSFWKRMLSKVGFKPGAAGPGPVYELHDLPRMNADAVAAIDCGDAPVRNEDLRYLRYARNLEELDLSKTGVTDEGMRHLRGLKSLRALWLPRGISPKGLRHLRGLDSLEWLVFPKKMWVQKEGLDHITGLKSLVYLGLAHTSIDDRALIPVGKIHSLEHLVLNNTKIGDRGLAHLKDLTRLRTLNLDWTRVTDMGLRPLDGMTSMAGFFLTGTDVTNAGMACLENMKSLQALSLSRTRVGDETLAYLSDKTDLWYLELFNTLVTDEGLAHLKDLKGLKHLNLVYTPVRGDGLVHLRHLKLNSIPIDTRDPITDTGLACLVDIAPIAWLPLTFSHEVTDDGLACIADLETLIRLSLPDQITDGGLAHVRRLRNLVDLALVGSRITDDGLRHLGNLKRLRNLNLSHTEITGSGLVHLTDLPHLTQLGLDNTKVELQQLLQLERCKSLRSVSQRGVILNQQEREELQTRMPSCRFYFDR